MSTTVQIEPTSGEQYPYHLCLPWASVIRIVSALTRWTPIEEYGDRRLQWWYSVSPTTPNLISSPTHVHFLESVPSQFHDPWPSVIRVISGANFKPLRWPTEEGKRKSPCPVCVAAGHRAQSKIPHKHALATAPSGKPWNNEFQVDKEKPLNLREPVTPAWSHFHANGAAIIEPQLVASVTGGKRAVPHTAPQNWPPTDCRKWTIHYPEDFYPETVEQHDKNLAARERLKGTKRRCQVEDKYKGSDLSKPFDSGSTVPVAKVDPKLLPWVRSQKHHNVDPNIRKLHTLGRYKTILRVGDYNSTEENYGESGDSAGANAPISAHKTGKYYGGDARHPENGSNTTGWAGYVDIRRISYRELLFDKECEQVLESAEWATTNGVPAVFNGLIELIKQVPADEAKQMEDNEGFVSPRLPIQRSEYVAPTDDVLEAEETNEEIDEPISDLEPDVFEADEAEETDEEIDEPEDEVEKEAVAAVESVWKDKPFESEKRPYALDEPPERWDEGESDEPEVGRGFADIDAVQKWKRDANGYLKPRKGRRMPWWCGSPQEPRTEEQQEEMKRPYQLATPCWPKGTVIYPLEKDFSLIDLVAVSAAGEKLIWKQVEELCKRTVEKDGKQEPGLIWKAEWTAEEWTGTTFVTRHRQHWYGRSILNPDMAFKNETYINVNPILRTTGAAAEKENEQQQANEEAIEEARKHPHLIPLTIHGIAWEDVEKSMNGRIPNELVIKYPDKTSGDWKQARHEYRERAKKNGDPLARWMRALKASGIDADEPGIFALTHFTRRKDRIYKIADVDDTDEAAWNKFHNLVMGMVEGRVKNGKLKPKGDAELIRQQAIDAGFEPPTDIDIAIREVYWEYADKILQSGLVWVGQPFSASQEAAHHAWKIVCDDVARFMQAAGFVPEELGFTFVESAS